MLGRENGRVWHHTGWPLECQPHRGVFILEASPSSLSRSPRPITAGTELLLVMCRNPARQWHLSVRDLRHDVRAIPRGLTATSLYKDDIYFSPKAIEDLLLDYLAYVLLLR